jgi:hypothetical protein
VACTQTPACACAWHVYAHICSALHHGELRLRRRLVPMGACRRASAAPTLTLTLNLSLRPKPEARSPSPSGTLTLTRRAAAAAQCLQRAGAAWHEYHLGARLVFLRPHQRTVPTQARRHSGNRSLTRRPNLTPNMSNSGPARPHRSASRSGAGSANGYVVSGWLTSRLTLLTSRLALLTSRLTNWDYLTGGTSRADSSRRRAIPPSGWSSSVCSLDRVRLRLRVRAKARVRIRVTQPRATRPYVVDP